MLDRNLKYLIFTASLSCLGTSVYAFEKNDLYIDSSAAQLNNNASNLLLQLDFTFHRGLEAIRIMALEGFNKSATFVNTAQSSEMLNR